MKSLILIDEDYNEISKIFSNKTKHYVGVMPADPRREEQFSKYLNFEKENLSIKYGEKAENKLNGFNSEYGTLIYSSSDSKVASVDTNGNVTGNDIGKATITAALDSESYVFGDDSDGREINDEIQGQINEYIVKMEEITGKQTKIFLIQIK